MADDLPTVEEVVAEVEAWVDQSWDPEITVREWWRRMADARLTSPTLPEGVGGRGWPRSLAAAVGRTLGSKRVVSGPGGLGMLLAAPTISDHGTSEQHHQWMPGIMDGTESWCQLFSEPNAGSDLASLQCRAERDGDEWVISGQKVWTSNGQEADWGMLIARTDPDAPKHRGISYFGFSMDQPGVEVRPLTEMTGRALFNEVFIDEARVPHTNLIGDLNDGWRVANTTLAYERAGIGGGEGGGYGSAAPGNKVGHLEQPVGEFLGRRPGISAGAVGRRVSGLINDIAKEKGLASDPVVRQDLAQFHTYLQLVQMNMLRQKAGGQRTGAEGNLAKLHNTRILHLTRHLVGTVLGPDAQLFGKGSVTDSVLQEMILFSPAPSIYGGSDEIQRNVIGERALGLPKEPGPSKDTPFKDLLK
ncbi:MAG: acyl-CoA dehydrogenase [Actinomycetia bacterium]|nr:acyl-CoA dehydrogenase [Actinomycetes bacterium]MCP3910739.1 acyl-CoA dehydrogenase [Actinomycetes bacterium]MCP4084469.1 acyl-CoA dehydrogenase [Actinomycetes bacterium]